MIFNKFNSSFKNFFKNYLNSRRSDFILSIYMLTWQAKPAFFLHYLNMVLSKAKYIFSKRKKLLLKENFQTNKFLILNEEFEMQSGDKKLLNELLGICKFMENPNNKTYGSVKYVLLENFTFIQNSLTNQTHFDNITPNLISLVADSFKNSEIFAIAESVSSCQLTVCNLRCWLFYARSKEVDSNINLHTDWFPPGFLKVMFYKGNFTQENPALTVFKDGEMITVVGMNPIVLFDANRVIHGAPAPIQGFRPTVEFTLMPSFFQFELRQAGFQAGYPVNPFKSYSRPYTVLFSK